MSPSINASPSDLIRYVHTGINRAVVDGRHPWRLPILITSGEGRVVVLRGVDAKNGSWRFFTDLRTPKVKQLAGTGGLAGATFYNAKDRTQVRLTGVATLVPQVVHREVWDKLAAHQKSSYAAFPVPGSVIEHAGDGLSDNWAAGNPSLAEHNAAFENFGIYDFRIEKVELLLLHREGHRRCRWIGWHGDNFEWLVP